MEELERLSIFIPQIHELAQQSPDQEIGGAIIEDEIIHSNNIAADSNLNFEIDQATLIQILVAIKKNQRPIIWHTHCNDNSEFSELDIKSSTRWKLPFFLYHPRTAISRFFDPLDC